MLLEAEELQYIANAIDTHIRSNGLAVAAQGVAIIAKIQESLRSSQATSSPAKDSEPANEADKGKT